MERPRPYPKERLLVATNMRRLRKAQGLSQERLGDEAGVHRTEVSMLERAERDPRLSTLIRVARALGVPPADLLKGVR